MATTPKTFSGTDSMNFWTDSIRRGYGFRLTDSMNFLADSLKVGYGFNLVDNANFLADSLGVGYGFKLTEDINLLTDSARIAYGLLYGLTDGTLQNWADALGLGEGFNLAGDTLNTWTDSSSASVALLVRPPADDLNTWSDSLGGLLAYNSAQVDGMAAYEDSLSGFQDYKASLDADSMAIWSDSISGLLSHEVVLTDNWPIPDDSLYGLLAHFASSSDSMDNWQDFLDSLYGYQVFLGPEDANAWADSLQASTAAELKVALTDAMEIWSDSLGISLVVIPSSGAQGGSVGVLYGYFVSSSSEDVNTWADFLQLLNFGAMPTIPRSSYGT